MINTTQNKLNEAAGVGGGGGGGNKEEEKRKKKKDGKEKAVLDAIY